MKVVYLIQGDRSEPLYRIPKGSDLLYLQWQADFQPAKNNFHFPGSSWAEGRNELYRRARLKGQYDYFIFMDDDLSFDGAENRQHVVAEIRKLALTKPSAAFRLWRSYANCLASPPTLESFERLLEENGSLVAAPRHWRHPWNADHSFQDVEATTFADSCMVAVHHSVADTLLPLTTEFDDVNWWICGEIFFERAAKLYWGRVHRFSNLHVWNKRNRPYPKERGGWMVSLNRIGEAIRKPMPSVAASRTRPPSLDKHTAVVVTSIAQSTKALRIIGRRCGRSDFTFFIIGDAKTPADFQIDGADYWSVGRQKTLPFRLARALPENHYSRKNIGYLLALQDPNTRFIVETDDDNLPLAEFWRRRQLVHEVDSLTGTGWLNAYRYFTDRNVWPRGFPLQQIAPGTAVKPQPVKASRDCFVQQGLAQHDPDVDAIFRLTQPLPIWFRDRRPIYLEPGLWCPINSQNTTWSVDVAALMYLPTLCPMRETDIWRGLVAQRVLWALGAGVMVHQASVIQDRNIHDLDHDFREESRLYAQVAAVAGALGDLTLAPGRKAIEDNLRRCYEEMVRLEIFPSAELSLLESWCDDLAMIGGPSHHADKPA